MVLDHDSNDDAPCHFKLSLIPPVRSKSSSIMNIFSSSTILPALLLSGIDLSLSFLAHPRHRLSAENVNAANVGGGGSSFAARRSKSKSLLFYHGGDCNENFFLRADDGSAAAASSGGFLRRVVGDALRGGGGGGASNSGGATSANNNSGDYRALSVAELKRLLNDRGVDYRDCLEKRDLVERLIRTRGLAAPPSSSASYSDNNGYYGAAAVGTRGGGLSHEENRVVNTFTRASPAVAYIQTMISQEQIAQRRGFSLKGTEVPTGAGSGFLWDDKVSRIVCCFLFAPGRIAASAFGIMYALIRRPPFSSLRCCPRFSRVTS